MQKKAGNIRSENQREQIVNDCELKFRQICHCSECQWCKHAGDKTETVSLNFQNEQLYRVYEKLTLNAVTLAG